MFIDALAELRGQINATVASSEASAQRLKQHGIPVFDLNAVDRVDFYIDGADEINHYLQMIKGGGAALTVDVSAEVVDDDLGAALGESEGVRAAETAAGTGDDRDAVGEVDLGH